MCPPPFGLTKTRHPTSFAQAKARPGSTTTNALACGVAAFYRNGYKAGLVVEWLPALEGVQKLLEAGIDVADVGCGHGHSTLFMAEAFPNPRFHGFDTHAESITSTRTQVAGAGAADPTPRAPPTTQTSNTASSASSTPCMT